MTRIFTDNNDEGFHLLVLYPLAQKKEAHENVF